MTIENKMELARAANDEGRYNESIDLLKEYLEEAIDSDSRINAAGAIYSTIIHSICGGYYPDPGTAEYEECKTYLKIQLETYDQADPITRAEFKSFEDVDDLKNILKQMEQGLPVRDKASTKTALSEEPKKSGCFIATAVYGSALSPEVIFFRHYRDDVLVMSRLGRAFIHLYHSVSPPLAFLISKHEPLRTMTRRFLLEPILHSLKKG